MMTAYEPQITALLCIDFYNDFLSDGGKIWPEVKETAEEVGLLDNLRAVVAAARAAGITIFHVPHHRWEPGAYDGWKYTTEFQAAGDRNKVFAKDTWGGSFHEDFPVRDGDVLVTEHWASSGFPNTNLDYQLRRHGKEKIICIGMIANTCLEATARIGSELGYHVTLVRDATAARSREAMHAALDINGPTYAHEILTTAELIETLGRTPIDA